MLSDKKEKPLGLKITNFLVSNVIWYILFSIIFWDINPLNWWVITNVWGRIILVFLELGIIRTSFENPGISVSGRSELKKRRQKMFIYLRKGIKVVFD